MKLLIANVNNAVVCRTQKSHFLKEILHYK